MQTPPLRRRWRKAITALASAFALALAVALAPVATGAAAASAGEVRTQSWDELTGAGMWQFAVAPPGADTVPASRAGSLAVPTAKCDVKTSWLADLPPNPPAGWFYCAYGLSFIPWSGYVGLVGANYNVYWNRHNGSSWGSWRNIGGVARSGVIWRESSTTLIARVLGTNGGYWCNNILDSAGWSQC